MPWSNPPAPLIILPPGPLDDDIGWAASAPEVSMKTRVTAAGASDRRRGDLIGMDDGDVALDLVAFERTARPLWTLPALLLHPEAAP